MPVNLVTKDAKLRDWRGNIYGVGDNVIYPRIKKHSVEMQEARVLDICPMVFIESAPVDQRWRRAVVGENYDVLKILVQPVGPGSCEFIRQTENRVYLNELRNITAAPATAPEYEL